METAMTLLKKWVVDNSDPGENIPSVDLYNKIDELLAIEREQHIETFISGDQLGGPDIHFIANKYFTQKYGDGKGN